MYRTSNGAYTNSISLALDQPFNDNLTNQMDSQGFDIKDRVYLINRPLDKPRKVKKLA